MALHGRFPSGEISFYPCASSARSCRSCGCGPLPVRRSRVASRSDYTRGQSQETGSLSKLFGNMEITAKCVSVGPAHCRERLQNPVRFSSTLVDPGQTLVMEREVDTLLRKEAIEVLPPHERESGFYSQYFIVSKKYGWMCPILDLRQLNRSSAD